MLATTPFDPRVRTGGPGTAVTVRALEDRLSSVERELRLQFTRIAQLQAEVDLMSGALRHAQTGTGRPTRGR